MGLSFGRTGRTGRTGRSGRSGRRLLASTTLFAALASACAGDDSGSAPNGPSGGAAGTSNASAGNAGNGTASAGASGTKPSANAGASGTNAGANAGGSSTNVGTGGANAGTSGANAGTSGASAGAHAGVGGTSTSTSGGAAGATSGVVSKGGTMTFHGIGGLGYWGRRILAEPGDPDCDVQGEYVNTFGVQTYCCRTKHVVPAEKIPLAPFNEQMTLILRGPLAIDRFAVYQPGDGKGAAWTKRSAWERSKPAEKNDVVFDGPNDTKAWTGDIGDGCHWYAMRAKTFACGASSDPYCPESGPDLRYWGWEGSKLLVFAASMPDASDPSYAVPSCEKNGVIDAPWVGFSASELMRDGAGKFHPCHCYANTNAAVGDGCGEINVWETVPENQIGYGNRSIMSTGLRSFQFGGLGGSVCGVNGCPHALFGDDVDLVDACKHTALTKGADLSPGGNNGCPVWRRPRGPRYFVALLDEATSTVKIALVHPEAIPASLGPLLPALPTSVTRADIDALIALSLP